MAWVVTEALWSDDLGLTGPFGAKDEDGPDHATPEELAAARISPYRFRIVNLKGEVAIEGRSDQPVDIEGLWFQFDHCEAFQHHYNLLQELRDDGEWITLNGLRFSTIAPASCRPAGQKQGGRRVPENSKMEQRRLVYGEYWMHGSFAVLDATLAEGLSNEIQAIQACTTVGQARALEPTLKFTWLPDGDFEDDDGEPLPDDAPYDWSQTGAVQEGDWPPMPDQCALEGLPTELLNALMTRAGARRDDDLVASIGLDEP